MAKTNEVWFTFRNRDKSMLLELTNEQVQLLAQPNQKIEATRTYKGEVSKVGFNTDDVITYEYKEAALYDEVKEIKENDQDDTEYEESRTGRKKIKIK